jgi:hypothetical protein
VDENPSSFIDKHPVKHVNELVDQKLDQEQDFGDNTQDAHIVYAGEVANDYPTFVIKSAKYFMNRTLDRSSYLALPLSR